MLTIVIPARGGSKGIPNKNVATVGGIPLVGRAARTARQVLLRAGRRGRVVCSTDSPAIAAAAAEWGAEIPYLRPGALATDDTPTMDVLLELIAHLELAPESTLAVIQPTSPMVEADDVVRALDLHLTTAAPVVGVAEEQHPVEWSYHMAPDGRLAQVAGSTPVNRRQDGARRVRICGAVYVAGVEWLLSHRSFLHESTRGLLVPQRRAVDIDSSADLEAVRGMLAQSPRQSLDLGTVAIGPDHPPLVIAEAGVNHGGDLGLALRLVDAARAAGAGAVKFQTFKSESVASPIAEQAAYQRTNTGVAQSQLDMVRALELSTADTESLSNYCREVGLMFLSSPFDHASADLLIGLGVPAFKLGSGEITNHPFLAHLAAAGLPLLVSTGMSTLAEIGAALDVIDVNGAPQVALLHCVSSYPAPPEQANILAIKTLQEAFCRPVGWSDHTPDMHVAVAAVALGACVIEKHLTLDRSLPGPDHRASLEPDELAELVRVVGETWRALGDGHKRCMPCEAETRRVARRSLFATRDLPAGEVLRSSSVEALRPGNGISPARLPELVGRRVLRVVAKGKMLCEDDLG